MSYRDMRERLLTRPGVKAGYDKQVELSKLGRLIQRARVGSNLRQQDLASLSGVAQGDISRLEIGSGEKGPTFDTLVRLVHAQDMHLVMELVPNKPHESSASPSPENETLDDPAAEHEPPQALREAF